MHIVLTTNYSPWSPYSGGGQRSTHNLATALTNLGHQVDLVFTRSYFESFNIPSNLAYTAHWALLPSLKSKRASWLRNFTIFSVRNKVKALLKKKSVIHSNGEEGALLPNLRGFEKCPFIITPRYPRIPADIKNPNLSLVSAFLNVKNTKYYLLGKAVQDADLCSTTSKSTLQMLKRHYHITPAKEAIIPNGVDELFLEAEPKNDFSGPLIFFGRLSYSKGIDTLIDALPLINKPDLKLLIIGRGKQQRNLERQARKNNIADQIIFKPWMSQEELKDTLEKSSFAVLPSREESFGNTMAEAMATGTPVISTTAGSIPEVVINGKTGLLVEPGNVQALSNAIKKLISDPSLARSFASKARKHIKENYTWTAVAQAYEREYKQLLP